jgi:hypothetical protein
MSGRSLPKYCRKNWKRYADLPEESIFLNYEMPGPEEAARP